MIKAINMWAFPGGLAGKIDPIHAMEEAKEAGFQGIELCIADHGMLTDQTSRAQCEAIRKAAKSIGISIVSVATGQFWQWSLTAADAPTRKKAKAFAVRMIERARWLGADAVLIVPGCVHADFVPDCPKIPYDFAFKTAKTQLKSLARSAAKHRVHLCVENTWNKFLYSPLEFRDFLASTRSARVGAYFDVANVMAYGIPEDWIGLLGKRIKRVHFKDYQRRVNADESTSLTPFPEGFACGIGEGDVNFPAVMKALKKIGYRGPATAEVLNFTDNPDLVWETSEQMDRVIGQRKRVFVTVGSDKPAKPLAPLQISLAGWSIHRRFLDKKSPLSLLDYPQVVKEEFDIDKAELNSPFFEYENPDDPATSNVKAGYLDDLRKRAEDVGVELVGVAVDDHGDLSSLNEWQRQKAVWNHRKWFDICRELGCSAFRANSGGWDDHLTETHVEQCVKSFRKLAHWAEETGVKVMMENHWGLSANPEWMLHVIEQVNSEWFGALPDFGNFPPEVDKYKAFEMLAPHATFVHAKYTAFNKRGEDPKVDTPRLLKIFRHAGYDGLYGIEFEGQGDDHEGVIKSKALLEKHYARLR